jgi:hypothetical protein
MAEDSGAFKTNPRNHVRFPSFVMIVNSVAAKPHLVKEALPALPTGTRGRDF